jgi:hypothetical protein
LRQCWIILRLLEGQWARLGAIDVREAIFLGKRSSNQDLS